MAPAAPSSVAGTESARPFRGLLVGPTNIGKSSIINRCIGVEPFTPMPDGEPTDGAAKTAREGSGNDGCTANCESYYFEHKGRTIELVDSAGAGTTTEEATSSAGLIAEMEDMARQGDRFDVILYCVNATQQAKGLAAIVDKVIRYGFLGAEDGEIKPEMWENVILVGMQAEPATMRMAGRYKKFETDVKGGFFKEALSALLQERADKQLQLDEADESSKAELEAELEEVEERIAQRSKHAFTYLQHPEEEITLCSDIYVGDLLKQIEATSSWVNYSPDEEACFGYKPPTDEQIAAMFRPLLQSTLSKERTETEVKKIQGQMCAHSPSSSSRPPLPPPRANESAVHITQHCANCACVSTLVRSTEMREQLRKVEEERDAAMREINDRKETDGMKEARLQAELRAQELRDKHSKETRKNGRKSLQEIAEELGLKKAGGWGRSLLGRTVQPRKEDYIEHIVHKEIPLANWLGRPKADDEAGEASSRSRGGVGGTSRRRSQSHRPCPQCNKENPMRLYECDCGFVLRPAPTTERATRGNADSEAGEPTWWRKASDSTKGDPHAFGEQVQAALEDDGADVFEADRLGWTVVHESIRRNSPSAFRFAAKSAGSRLGELLHKEGGSNGDTAAALIAGLSSLVARRVRSELEAHPAPEAPRARRFAAQRPSPEPGSESDALADEDPRAPRTVKKRKGKSPAAAEEKVPVEVLKKRVKGQGHQYLCTLDGGGEDWLPGALLRERYPELLAAFEESWGGRLREGEAREWLVTRLDESDIDSISMKTLRRDFATAFNMDYAEDVKPHKETFKALVDARVRVLMQARVDAAGGEEEDEEGEEGEEDEEAAAEEEEEEQQQQEEEEEGQEESDGEATEADLPAPLTEPDAFAFTEAPPAKKPKPKPPSNWVGCSRR